MNDLWNELYYQEWLDPGCDYGCLTTEEVCGSQQTVNPCDVNCQNVCESACQCSGQNCQTCQDACMLSCQCSSQGCMSCQCEDQGCQSCQCSTQGCQSCQCSTQGCQACLICQSTCERSCQPSIESCSYGCLSALETCGSSQFGGGGACEPGNQSCSSCQCNTQGCMEVKGCSK